MGIAISQFISATRVGYAITYVGPLGFVLLVTLISELVDELKRYRTDKAINNKIHQTLNTKSEKIIKQRKNLCVGDLVVLNKNENVPADLVLLKTFDESGTCFVRTDQLDGETDWKLRSAVSSTQKLNEEQLCLLRGRIIVEEPNKDIYSVNGYIQNDDQTKESLSIENFLWANTVIASNGVIGVAVYTGKETRAIMNTNKPQTKMGIFDKEINKISKMLFVVSLMLSFILVALNNFRGVWYILFARFMILFSSIIPLSLKVNLDFAKNIFASMVVKDKSIPNTIVRTSTIPEELGRIEYLLSDKTGTLTQNNMLVRKIHLGTFSYGKDTIDEIKQNIVKYYQNKLTKNQSNPLHPTSTVAKNTFSQRLYNFVNALALCHNVTPVIDENSGNIEYQASSPDEIAIVEWTALIGISLLERTRDNIILKSYNGNSNYKILNMFPFTSETKRMGIIIKNNETDEIVFYLKGADSVMTLLVGKNDWLDEECGNMAREGLRTLVVARKNISHDEYLKFNEKLNNAMLSLSNRNIITQNIISAHLEKNLELLGIVGIEDKLQNNVKQTLETLRNAGIKVWMITGDKVETATSIALSSKLVSKTQIIKTISKMQNYEEIKRELESISDISQASTALVIDGDSIKTIMDNNISIFAQASSSLPAVVCCRCSPTQKAELVNMIKNYTKKRVCCIGDGGNDVSMIQMSNVGIGIVGKEGKQASLAADYSITEFSHITKLILWHGRNSYKRSAKLSQFIIHRGLIISIMQALFSAIFYFAPVSLYQGFLLVGYVTIFTNAPVFSLILDKDASENIVMMYPELYKELGKGRQMSPKMFFQWLTISTYQGGSIMLVALYLFEYQFINIVSISFTALILNELLMVVFEIKTWHKLMVYSEILSISLYILSMFILKNDFDISFILSITFIYKVALITAISCIPLYILKALRMRYSPPSYTKLA